MVINKFNNPNNDFGNCYGNVQNHFKQYQVLNTIVIIEKQNIEKFTTKPKVARSKLLHSVYNLVTNYLDFYFVILSVFVQ